VAGHRYYLERLLEERQQSNDAIEALICEIVQKHAGGDAAPILDEIDNSAVIAVRDDPVIFWLGELRRWA